MRPTFSAYVCRECVGYLCPHVGPLSPRPIARTTYARGLGRLEIRKELGRDLDILDLTDEGAHSCGPRASDSRSKAAHSFQSYREGVDCALTKAWQVPKRDHHVRDSGDSV